jgi:hypothetical protein
VRLLISRLGVRPPRWAFIFAYIAIFVIRFYSFFFPIWIEKFVLSRLTVLMTDKIKDINQKQVRVINYVYHVRKQRTLRKRYKLIKNFYSFHCKYIKVYFTSLQLRERNHKWPRHYDQRTAMVVLKQITKKKKTCSNILVGLIKKRKNREEKKMLVVW